MLEAANKGLFCQLITIPLFKDHKILTQVAGHGSHTIKLLPPYVITDEDCGWIEKCVRRGDRRQPPGAGRDLVARQDAGRQCDGREARLKSDFRFGQWRRVKPAPGN